MVGKVTIDYSKYMGQDYYTDGSVEEILLDSCMNGTEDELLRQSRDWPIVYHLADIRENVLEWYPIEKNDEVLEIGSGCGAITGILSKKAKSVTCVELSEKRSMINAYRHKNSNNIEIKLGNFQDVEPDLKKYDCITLIGVLEYAYLYIKGNNPFIEMLNIVRNHLKKSGKLIIAIENKMGIKYLNGAPEDHTGKLYSGINDYTKGEKVKTFSDNEIKTMLYKSGFEYLQFYYPVPDYKLPNTIYSKEYQPKPGEIRTYKKVYSKERVYNFYEDVICDQLCADHMYSYMANSFVIIAGLQDAKENNILFAKYNRERKPEYRILTQIEKRGQQMFVIKKPLCKEARTHIENIKYNELEWKGTLKNIECVNGEIDNGSYVARYVNGITFDEKFYDIRNDSLMFVQEVRKLVETYLLPEKDKLQLFEVTDGFKKVFGELYPSNAQSTVVSNVDLIFSNLKTADNGKVYAFDFEWVFDFPVPYRYIIWRAEKELYNEYRVYLKNQIDIDSYFKMLGMSMDEVNIYNKMENNFFEYVCGLGGKEKYLKQYEKTVLMNETIFC